MQRLQLFFENIGLAYEQLVTKIIRKATGKLKNIAVLKSSGGAFDAHSADLSIRIKNKIVGFEIKANNRAQMGSSSIGFSEGEFFVKLDDPSVNAIVENALYKKKPEIEKVLTYFEKNDPAFKLNKRKGFPLNVSENSWKEAVTLGHVKSMNSYIKDDVEFVKRHYQKKGINYIQIGGNGLFNVGNNPLHISVPELDGDLIIEFRAVKSGKKTNKTLGVDYSTVILRMVGRLYFSGKSSISLDNLDDCVSLFEKLN
jgi:hypothetical protein